MSLDALLSQIDQQIARLQKARDILASDPASPIQRKKRGLSAEGRQRIADAQRRRWAAANAPTVTVLPPVRKRSPRAPRAPALPIPSGVFTSSIPVGAVAVRAQDVQALRRKVVPTAEQSAHAFLIGEPTKHEIAEL